MLKKILDVDIGNSRIKWMVNSGEFGVVRNDEFADFCEVDFGAIDRIRVSCVAGNAFKRQVLEFLEEKYACKSEAAISECSCAGLVNKYADPSTLGVDRWLACLAAWHESKKKATLIIDAGSAITIDTINDKSEFIGGYIVPGFEMMQKVLAGSASQIACDISAQFYCDYSRLPTNTQDAVQKGAGFSILATAERAIHVFLQRWPDGCVYFTGGYGAEIAEAIGVVDCYRPDLVLDGLAIALP